MCTKEDLIEYLEDLPTGTKVDVLVQDTDGYNAYSEWIPLVLGTPSFNCTLSEYEDKPVLRLGSQ